MSSTNSDNNSGRRLASWDKQPISDYEYRRQLAEQEPVFGGLCYAAAAGVAGAALVTRSRSAAVKVLTPLAFAALTGNYFLPAHSDYYFHNMGRPLRFGRVADVDLRQPDKTSNLTTENLKTAAEATVKDVSREVGETWDDIKSKAEGLTDTYRTVGKEQASKWMDKSVDDANYWLNQQKAEVDSMLSDDAKANSGNNQGGLFSRMFTPDSSSEAKRRRTDDLRDAPLKPEEHWWAQQRRAEANTSSSSSSHNRFHDFDSSSPKKVEEPARASQYNFFGWWRSSDDSTDGTKPELKDKSATTGDHRAYVERKLEEANIKTSNKRRPSNADLHVAKEAVRGHDAALTRGAMLGKVDAETTARKVHDNVIDAAVPRDRQSSLEPHNIEETRSIYERTNKKLNKYKNEFQHGLENLDRRAHMMLQGVEHLEHSINKKMEKILQDEADFWHEQALKEEARARSMQAQANEANNARGERAF